jgi:phosphoglycerate dehydrogenase-like enzyme
LALAVARNVPFIDREIRAGRTITKSAGGAGGMQLSGKTLGLIGGGNIGSTVGRMFYGAFGAKIILYDPYLSPEKEALWASSIPSSNLQRVDSLDQLLPFSDVVSVHVPLLPSTRDMLRELELKSMKRSAVLVNTARGGIVNEEALVTALNEGWIVGAGVDAHIIEPPVMANYSALISHPRVITT